MMMTTKPNNNNKAKIELFWILEKLFINFLWKWLDFLVWFGLVFIWYRQLENRIFNPLITRTQFIKLKVNEKRKKCSIIFDTQNLAWINRWMNEELFRSNQFSRSLIQLIMIMIFGDFFAERERERERNCQNYLFWTE